MLRESAAKSPEKMAVVCGERTMTYRELNEQTDALARSLLAAGLEEGDRVAIHWANSKETVQLYFACFKAGLIAVPVNNRLKAAEIEYVLGHSKAKLCFSEPALASMTEEVRGACPDLRAIYTAVPEAWTAASGNGHGSVALPEVSPEKTAAVMYTSGTTARPKGVMHTHISLTGGTELMYRLGIDESHTLLAVTQMMHIAALGCVLLPGIRCGATVVAMPAFEPGLALEAIERWKCSFVMALPAMLRAMVEEQGRNPRDVRSTRCCVAGGDTVPVTLQERFKELFGAPVRELYGMTESVPMTCILEGQHRAGSMGPAMELIEARVMKPGGGLAGVGESGELQVQSAANCVGYWDDPIATAATFDDGWMRTGDLVRRDEDGYFWFEGRLKQIIVRGGSNISPQEVEEALYHHPAVLEAGVIGMPDEAYGEKVVAFVALREGKQASEAELRELVKGKIADYKVPERVLFLPSLPKGLTGKVQRRALGDLAI
jgi:long-chain acyl-CoA synthetase